MKAVYFRSPEALRDWFAANHARSAELLVGFHKKKTGKPSITYHEALDEALCFGWIDGVRKSVDETRYTIRFTPRKAKSNWSAVNIARAEKLRARRLMRSAGLEAFEKRDLSRAHRYSYENRPARLGPPYERLLKANKKAWAYYRAQAPSYQRTATWWIMSAKKEETRLRRLESLIEASEKGIRLF